MRRSKSPPVNALLICCLPVLLTILPGCSVTQVVPLQIGRISQTDSYTQKFSFLHELPGDSSRDQNLNDRLLFAQTRKMDEIFKQMIGKKNWQNLKDLYGLGNLRNELLEKRIYIKGTANMTIYPDPFDARYFSVDGFGRYFLIREKTEAILLTGDYSFSDQRHSVADLEKGYVVLEMRLFLIKIPGLVTYYHEAPLKYKIYIDNSLGAHRVYSIDYSRKHQAYLVEEDEELSEIEAFATISFTPPARPLKLWDLRGIRFMRRDYEKLLKERRD